jgi:outer membrane biosynthesis protein TonB
MQACAALNLIAGSTLALLFTFAGCGEKPPATSANDAKPVVTAPEPKTDDEPAATDGKKTDDGDDAEKSDDGDDGDDKGAPEKRTTEVIQQIIVDNRKPVRSCYDKVKKDLPSLQGTMTIHFVLDPEGAVKKAELVLERSEIKNAELADCAIGVIKKLKFPASSRGMESSINYPFNFKP